MPVNAIASERNENREKINYTSKTCNEFVYLLFTVYKQDAGQYRKLL
jgi:hypothetical protein